MEREAGAAEDRGYRLASTDQISQCHEVRIGRIETASTTDHLPLADSQPRGIVVYQPVGLVEPRDPHIFVAPEY